MRGRVCLVTGASSGIGKATALGLAHMGGTIILACRDSTRGENARREIIEASRNPEITLMLVDLSSQESIRSFAESFKQNFSRLHVLVNNAGIYTSRRVVTIDRLESTFSINYLSHFLLTTLLLDLLKASAPSRIVNVTSEAQRAGKINFSDLQGENRYSGMKAYSQSKLANVLFTYELARRLAGTGVTVNCVHPGTVRTNFGRESGGFMSVAVRVAAPFMLTPEAGARTVVYAASSHAVENVSGKYFIKEAEAKSSRDSYDPEIAKRLWDISTELAKTAT